MRADPRDGSRDFSLGFWGQRPSNRASIRRANLGIILRLLRDEGPRSRVRIAGATGLPKPTVTSLVAELVELGLAVEGQTESEGAIGRPGTTVHLDGRTVCGIGTEISADYVSVVVLTMRGDVLHERHQPIAVAEAGVEPVLDLVAALLAECLDRAAESGTRAAGIAVAAHGVVDLVGGRVRYAANLDWHDVEVLDGLRRRLGPAAPVLHLDNDAKLAALAEYLAIKDSDIHDLLYISAGSGIGGGIISGDRLLRGAAGFAGEIGHLPLDPRGRLCVCGRGGCWETMIGLGALLRLADASQEPATGPALASAPTPVPTSAPAPAFDAEQRLAELKRRALAGDGPTRDALHQVATDLGLGLGMLADILNPRAVVLGGYFAHIGDLMLDQVRTIVREHVMAPEAAACEILLSTLGFRAPALGAAHLALEDVYQDPAGYRHPSRTI
jgi:predicted NBD/HSP70 family sugar kinase